MDYNNNETMPGNKPVDHNANDSNYYNGNQPNGMATASLVLGILAIISLCCIYGSYIFGGIGITLALLSRGKNTKLSTNALIGTILSVIGMIIATVLIVISVILVFSKYGFENYMEAYEAYYEEITGEEFPFDSDTFNYDEDSNTFDFDYDNNNYDYDYDQDNQPQELDLPDMLTITFN
jgi:hypothetical protein